MATIEVHLGIKFNEHFVLTTPINEEFDPEQVFIACNRIGDMKFDIGRLPNVWQKELRQKLDTFEASSMSSGDYILLVSDKGHTIGRHNCLPMGWESIQLPLGDPSVTAD